MQSAISILTNDSPKADMIPKLMQFCKGADPVPQLYGQLLAAAHLNWKTNGQDPQEIFGCYTIADSWTFLRGEVGQLDAERPTLRVEYSREYSEKYDAEIILKILKQITNRTS